MTQTSTVELIKQSLSLSQKQELLRLGLKAANRNRWKVDGLAYLVERFGIPIDHIKWSLSPAYKNHQWDGTVDPLCAIIQALADNKWVGVESATGVGKTFLAALIVFWFLECFDNSFVITTAPKQKQLELHLWKEIGKLFARFGYGELQSLKLRMNPPHDEWVAVGETAGVRAEEVDQSATKSQGAHAEHMLIIVEETPGVSNAIMTAFQNTSTAPHNLILALGNPDSQLDSLHKFCMQDNVVKVRISAFDHPNVVMNNASYIKGAVSKAGLERLLKRYGSEENPLYLSRARGISPAQSTDSLIQLDWCYAARDRKVNEVGAEGIIGVDVANSLDGDKASIASGKGTVLSGVKSFQCPNANQLGHQVALIIKEKKIQHIAVDGVGVGVGTVNVLRDDYRLTVNDLMGGVVTMPGMDDNFNSLRSQMWWQMREDLRLGVISLPADEELFADLVTPRWMIRSGKICVEDKATLKKRLTRSPDKGDSAVYWNWMRKIGSMAITIAHLRGVEVEPSVTSQIEGW